MRKSFVVPIIVAIFGGAILFWNLADNSHSLRLISQQEANERCALQKGGDALPLTVTVEHDGDATRKVTFYPCMKGGYVSAYE